MTRTLLSRLAVPLLCVALASANAPFQDPEESSAVVLLPLTEKGEGAPSRAGLGRTVLLTSIRESDPWWRVVAALREGGIKDKDIVTVRPWDAERVRKALAKSQPEFAVVVLPPDELDVNMHFELLEQLSKLDGDPFVDVTFGYITGATPEEAESFARATIAARKARPKRSILEFGPSTSPAPLSGSTAHPWASGFTTRRLAHAEDERDVANLLAAAKDVGVLQAWGHGMPPGVDRGLQGREIRAARLDLFPALYFSGPCYCGVPGRWFDPSKGAIREAQVAPEESFLLALLGARVSAVFAGLDPDRGETNHQELEHLLSSGEPLGYATKGTYDDVVLAYRRPELSLPRYAAEKPDPHRNLAETMIAGGACRALFGDPSFAPFEKAGESAFEALATAAPKAIRITWNHEGSIGNYWAPVDVYRADGGWTHRLRFRVPIAVEKARRVSSFRVLSVTKDGQSLEVGFPTAALELFGGKAFLHVLIVFPRNEQDRALWNGKQFEARFECGTS
ncbi:MAG: hypothetical protein JNM84_02990 [Planctomycetes bacterium]|nr:hypothetical protein [Planctomycetota bacterium]